MSGVEKSTASNVVVYGRAGSTEGYDIRDFLMRSVVKFDWIDIADEATCNAHLQLSGFEDLRFPIVELPKGERLFAPSVKEVADRLGWVRRPRYKEYDVSIYGAGPAGLSAAVYAASEGLRTVIIERHAVGGQAGTSSLIENYMGFPEGIRGADLAELARQQAVKFGAEIILMGEGVEAKFANNRIAVEMADGSQMMAKSNICATGVEYRSLGAEREKDFLGRGVYYGAGAAEAPFCRKKRVYVVGGGNSAGQAAMHLADYAAKVTLLVRGETLSATMSSYLADRLKERQNVVVETNSQITSFDSDEELKRITITDRNKNNPREVETERVFICIGGAPNTDWARDTDIIRDSAGYLVTGPDLLDSSGQIPDNWPLKRQPYYLETSVPGSFAIGDVRHGSIKRVASAVGEGAMAVSFVHRFLEEAHSR